MGKNELANAIDHIQQNLFSKLLVVFVVFYRK